MDKGVLYLLAGKKHWNHFVVSLVSLKNHWDGPVCIACADDEALQMYQWVKDDGAFPEVIKVDIRDDFHNRRNGAYLVKTRMIDYSPFDKTVFLDADTLVVGSIEDIFPQGSEVRLTQFSDWVTTGKKMSKRIDHWKELLPDEVAHMQAHAYPAINTGVLGFSKKSTEFSEKWQEVSEQLVRFMVDELVAQLIYPEFLHTVLSDRYNASPVYSKSPYDDVRVWHGHGGKMHKNERGRKLWYPVFEAVLGENYANIQEWWTAPRYPGKDYKLKQEPDS